MLFDGIEILEGSSVVNFTFPTGASFPSNPDQGEIFYKTDVKKPYIYINAAWVEISTGEGVSTSGSTVTVVATMTGTTGVEGDLVYALDVNKLYIHDGTEFTASQEQIYDIAISSPGDVTDSSTLVYFVAPRNFSIPVSFSGSVARIGTSNGESIFTLYRNGTAAATITFADGETTGTFDVISSGNLTFDSGDVLSIDSPAGVTPTNLAITFKATTI